MELNVALFIWFILVVCIIVLSMYYGVNWFSSVALGLIIGIIILSLLVPASSLDQMFDEDGEKLVGVYWLIWVVTGLFLLFYVLKKSVNDRNDVLAKTCAALEVSV